MPNFTEKILDFLFKAKTEPAAPIEVKVVKPKKASNSDSPVPGFDGGIFGFKGVGINQQEFLENVRGWTYACVNVIAEQIAAIEILLYKTKGKDDVEEVKESEILNQLWMVNEYTTKYDFFWLISAYLEIVGEAPLFLDKDEGGKILGIYNLNPARIKPLPDKKNKRMIGAYRFMIDNGQYIDIPTDQLIMIKYANPANPVRGLGTMQAVVKAIDIENEAEDWNLRFFQNNATPGSVLKITSKNLTKEQRDRLKAKIDNEYRGTSRSQRLWVLFDNMELTPYGNIQKDMEFSKQQEFTKKKIMNIFRVPGVLLGDADVTTYASAKAVISVFQQTVILSKMERIIEQLNEFFVPQFTESEGVYLDFIPPVEDDIITKIAVYDNALKNGWMTLNEVRLKEGLPSYGPAGDRIYMPFNLMPVEVETAAKGIKANENRIRQLRTRPKPIISRDTIVKNLKDGIKKQILNSIKNGKKKEEPEPEAEETTGKKLDSERRKKFWEVKDATADKFIPKFIDKMNETFDAQEREVLANLRKEKDIKVNIKNILLDKKSQRNKIYEKFLPSIKLLMEQSSDETFTLLDVDMSLNIESDYLKEYMKSRTFKFADSSTLATNDSIKATIEEGIKLGEGIDEMSKRIANVFDMAKSYRSDRIARSEVIRFNNEASEQAFIESGIVESKEWVVNPGACDLCLEFDGKVIELGATFEETDYEDVEHPPLHVLCRCTIAPVLAPRKEFIGNSQKDILRMKKITREKDSGREIETEQTNKENLENIKNTIEDIKNLAVDEVLKKVDEAIKDDE